MTHVPRTHPVRTPPHVRRRSEESLLGELRTALASADLRLELLGDEPVEPDVLDAPARIDALARELVARMQAAGWDAGAAPCAVTSVLAASVPDAEAALLRVARFGGA